MTRGERIAALAGLVAISMAALFERGLEWQGEWDWTLASASDTTVLTGPAIAAVAAWLACSRHGLRSVTEAAPRGWLVPVRWTVSATALGLAALAVTTLVAVTATLVYPHGGPVDPLVFVEPPVYLAAYAAVGAVTGTRIPHPVTAVLIAPVTFVVAMVAGDHVTLDFLRATLGATASLAGLRWSGLTALGAVAGLAGVVGVSTLLALGARAPRAPKVALAAATLPFLTTSIVISHTHGTYPWVPSNESATVCAGDAPVVCVMPSNRAPLPALAAQVHRLASYLRDAGATVPARFRESLWPIKDPTIGYFDLNEGAKTTVNTELAADVLVTPSDCPAYSSMTGAPYLASVGRQLIKDWLRTQVGDLKEPTWGGKEGAWLRSPLAAQHAWIARTYAQLAACDFHDIKRAWKVERR